MTDTAMILAAGYGTRLKPLTDNLPKALIEYQGKPLIEHSIDKLIKSGIKKIVVNTHHLSNLIGDYFDKNNFDAEINLSYEEKILGTGGAIKNAKKYLSSSDFFVVHNVDIISDINLNDLYNKHQASNTLATLASQNRATSRPLIIDEENFVIGRKEKGEDIIYLHNSSKGNYTAFNGVSVLSTEVFDLFDNQDEFDIIPFYMSQINKCRRIYAYDIGSAFWRDIGKIQNI